MGLLGYSPIRAKRLFLWKLLYICEANYKSAMDKKQVIKNNLLHSLKKLNAFWSYDAFKISKNTISDEMLIEKSLVHLDIPDLKKLFILFPYKKIYKVWKEQLCIQEPYYHELNTMLACLYFDIKNPERYLKRIRNKHIKLLKQWADEWFSATYGKDF
jgi:hypothetical protein